MHKINLTGTLCISSELMSRLQKRGLLSSLGECTDDFVIYIQECIARDDMRYPMQSENHVSIEPVSIRNSESSNSQATAAIVDGNVQQESVSVKKEVTNGISSLIEGLDIADLKHSMSTLYRGGTK